MDAKTLFAKAKEQMKPEEIKTWCSDVYLKVTPISKSLIDDYDWKQNVNIFTDNIDHESWYEIPFGNPSPYYIDDRSLFKKEAK